MGCVQAKTLEGPGHEPKGLDRLKLENGYVSNSDFAAHRRSTGQRYEPMEDANGRHHHQKRESQPRNRSRVDEPAAGVPGGHNGESGKGKGGVTRERKKRDLAKKKTFEDDYEMVDGWPKWLVDNVPAQVFAGLVPRSAESYKMIDKVGQGTYSNVYKALDRETREIVALKKVRFNTSEPESIKFMAREIMILQRLDHPNVLKLKGLATSRMQYSIYLVFEFMQTDLTRIISHSEERLTEPQVKCYMQQLLSGLQHCHERGILHRDIKGSNLLIDKHGMLKIADFGLANYYSPNREHPLTSRVVTLWYRAPELLLGATDYGVGIDLWSAGCLLAEMLTGIPLMPGRTEFFFTSPLACDLSGLPVIHREDDEIDQAKEQIKYMNSKIRRSRTYLERRKSLAPKRQIEHTVSNKEDSRRNVEPETYIPSEEPGSATTSSTSSSVNPAMAKEQSSLSPFPLLASDKKVVPKVHHHGNVGENTRYLPPLPKSKPKATKNDDYGRFSFRSASTREFRNFKRDDYLLFEID
ncbi:hypothetical protein PIB30_000888 [Stylosanthes scabra]|uniref:Protein kinase domain-containing protein n=1 Tax=Stylosanthes scabra TaxID=79078 RepID=A0ABU6R349_9FABA|nr:hypothetical protein [Stylosanthes scabra]